MCFTAARGLSCLYYVVRGDCSPDIFWRSLFLSVIHSIATLGFGPIQYVFARLRAECLNDPSVPVRIWDLSLLTYVFGTGTSNSD